MKIIIYIAISSSADAENQFGTEVQPLEIWTMTIDISEKPNYFKLKFNKFLFVNILNIKS